MPPNVRFTPESGTRRTVGHETSREEILAERIYGWQHMMGRQPDHAITLA